MHNSHKNLKRYPVRGVGLLPVRRELILRTSSCSSMLASFTTPMFFCSVSAARKGHLEPTAWPAGGAMWPDGNLTTEGSTDTVEYMIYLNQFKQNKCAYINRKNCLHVSWEMNGFIIHLFTHRVIITAFATDRRFLCVWLARLKRTEFWLEDWWPAPSAQGTYGHSCPVMTWQPASDKHRAQQSGRDNSGSLCPYVILLIWKRKGRKSLEITLARY